MNGFFARVEVLERIARARPSLTEAHRRVADYVLANPFRAASMMIEDLADAVGVSTATANRFARTLGFEGYPQFRTELAAGFESALAPVEKLRSGLQRPATHAEIVSESLQEDIRNLEATRSALSTEACQKAVEAILGAERVLVIGFGASGYLAGLLQHELDPYCRSVMCLAQAGGASHAARQIFKAGPRDLVIALAFPRYVSDTVILADLAAQRRARILAITDGPSSPLAPLADIVLYVRTERQLSSTSNTAALGMIEALCGAVAHRARNSLAAAQSLTEFVLPWLYKQPARRASARGARAPGRTARGR